MNKLPIPFKDYRRIFCTIYSLLESEEHDLSHSCIYFSFAGATILRNHYKIEANVFMGLAAFRVIENDDELLMFAELKGNRLESNHFAFHSWVKVGEWFIDFSAPQFPKMYEASGNTNEVNSKMFQKHVSEMAETPNDLNNVGDFFFAANKELTNEMDSMFESNPQNLDFLEVCSQWYRKPPRKMQKNICLGNGLGDTKSVQLRTLSVAGSW